MEREGHQGEADAGDQLGQDNEELLRLVHLQERTPQELDFDENDTLSAIVAALCSADLLIILTDVDGLYDKNPKLPGAKLIPEVKQITSEMISSAKDKGSEFASGGMITKLEAATIAKEHGIPTVIINGQRPEILYDLFENKAVCTVFTADED